MSCASVYTTPNYRYTNSNQKKTLTPLLTTTEKHARWSRGERHSSTLTASKKKCAAQSNLARALRWWAARNAYHTHWIEWYGAVMAAVIVDGLFFVCVGRCFSFTQKCGKNIYKSCFRGHVMRDGGGECSARVKFQKRTHIGIEYFNV